MNVCYVWCEDTHMDAVKSCHMRAPKHTNKHWHTHTHTFKHIYTYTHLQTHTHTRTYAHKHAQTYTCTHAKTIAPALWHARTKTNTYTVAFTHINTQKHVHAHTTTTHIIPSPHRPQPTQHCDLNVRKTHTHKYIRSVSLFHAHIHTYPQRESRQTHTQAHTQTHTDTHRHTHSHTHAHSHAHIHIHIHTHTYTHVHTHTNAHMYMHTHTYTHILECPYVFHDSTVFNWGSRRHFAQVTADRYQCHNNSKSCYNSVCMCFWSCVCVRVYVFVYLFCVVDCVRLSVWIVIRFSCSSFNCCFYVGPTNTKILSVLLSLPLLCTL